MSRDEDPARLADGRDDGAGGELGALIRRTRQARPSTAAMARMWTGVAPLAGAAIIASSGASGGAATAASTTAAASGSASAGAAAGATAGVTAGVTLKVVAVLALVGTAAGGGLAWRHAGRAHAPVAESAPAAVAPAPEPAAAPGPSATPPPAAAASAAPAPASERPARATPHPRPHRRAPAGGLPARAVSAPAPAVAPAVAAQPPPRPEPAPAPAPKAEPSPVEAQLVLAAAEGLRTSPARALELCAEHARRFPHGRLSEEREPIAIEALARLGRIAEARARAATFLARHPRSVHALRVRRVLEEADR